MAHASDEVAELAALVVAEATLARATLAVAESLTGGLVAAALVAIPGASAVVRLGVTAYATEMKAEVLGVDRALLSRQGPVDAEVAAQMASGVRALAIVDGEPATIGVSTTGVAGPDMQGGHPVGEVYVGVATSDGRRATRYDYSGNRSEVRTQAVRAALEAVLAVLRKHTAKAGEAQE